MPGTTTFFQNVSRKYYPCQRAQCPTRVTARMRFNWSNAEGKGSMRKKKSSVPCLRRKIATHPSMTSLAVNICNFERNFRNVAYRGFAMGATTAVSFCKYTEVTACAWCKYQCSAELRSRITEEFSHSAGGPNELGWARPSFSENPQNLYYPLGSSSTTAEMCQKTPLFCLSTVPTCLLDFFLDRHSFFPLASLADKPVGSGLRRKISKTGEKKKGKKRK